MVGSFILIYFFNPDFTALGCNCIITRKYATDCIIKRKYVTKLPDQSFQYKTNERIYCGC